MSEALKTVVLGDAAVQVALTDVAAVEAFKASASQKLVDAKASHDAAITAKDEEIGQLKADLKKAQDAANIDVDALVVARTELLAQVHAIDSKIESKGKTDAELRKAAVASKLGDSFVVDASDAEIAGMFKAIAKDAKPQNPVATALKAGVTRVGDAEATMQDAWSKANNDLNAWRDQ